METVATKPIIKEGGSLGAILEANETVSHQPVTVSETTEIKPTTEAQTIPVTTTASAESNGTTDAPASQAAPAPVEETNSSTFEIPDFNAPAPETTVTETAPATQTISQTVSWKDSIKNVSQEEILKELGFDDFDIELKNHRKNGGDPADYLFAKAIDYNKVSDAELVKSDLRTQYPTLTPSQIDLIFNKRYGASEDATDEEKEYAAVTLTMDAQTKRQQKITEQQKFKIAAPIATGKSPEQLQQEQNAAHQQQVQSQQQALQWFANHEATKNLMTSKRVALDLGEGVTFNVNVDKPESLMRVITDSEVWQKITTTPQGEPDVEALKEIALFALNRKKFKTDLFNYGKSFGLRTVVEEGRNAGIQKEQLPGQRTNETEKDVWKNPKSGTIGGGR
jgi:hypothetical protein